jgi:phosphoribosylformylglycinamidine synthase
LFLVKIKTDKNNLPDFDDLAEKYEKIYNLIKDGKVLSAYAVKGGGLCEAISKMAFGNKIGFKFAEIKKEELFYPYYGSIGLELSENLNFGEYIGTTTSEGVICAGDSRQLLTSL